MTEFNLDKPIVKPTTTKLKLLQLTYVAPFNDGDQTERVIITFEERDADGNRVGDPKSAEGSPEECKAMLDPMRPALDAAIQALFAKQYGTSTKAAPPQAATPSTPPSAT